MTFDLTEVLPPELIDMAFLSIDNRSDLLALSAANKSLRARFSPEAMAFISRPYLFLSLKLQVTTEAAALDLASFTALEQHGILLAVRAEKVRQLRKLHEALIKLNARKEHPGEDRHHEFSFLDNRLAVPTPAYINELLLAIDYLRENVEHITTLPMLMATLQTRQHPAPLLEDAIHKLRAWHTRLQNLPSHWRDSDPDAVFPRLALGMLDANERVFSENVLREASSQNNVPLVQALLVSGMEAGRQGGELQYTPLIAAVKAQHSSFYEVPKGLKREQVRMARQETIKALLSSTPGIDLKDHIGQTALHHAIEKFDDAEVVRLLVQAGASLDVQDIHGNTPLMKAARTQRGDVVNILLEAGASLELQNIQNQTAMELSTKHCRGEDTSVIQLLLGAGAECRTTGANSSAGAHLLMDYNRSLSTLLESFNNRFKSPGSYWRSYQAQTVEDIAHHALFGHKSIN